MIAHSIDSSWILKRSLLDNRQLIIKIVNLSLNGETHHYSYNYIFSSVFKLMQFQELFDQIRLDQIGTLLFQRFLRRHPYMEEICRMSESEEDSDDERQSMGTKEIQGDVGGSHPGSESGSQRNILLN